MAKSSETFNKKEKEKKRLKKQQEKKEKTEQRKANSDKGKGLEDMMAYIDENGNITSTPPALGIKKAVIDVANIAIATPKYVEVPEDKIRTGVISFYNTSKGFGFIRDNQSQENVFFHVNTLSFDAKENDKVTFETAKGPKGLTATVVKKS